MRHVRTVLLHEDEGQTSGADFENHAAERPFAKLCVAQTLLFDKRQAWVQRGLDAQPLGPAVVGLGLIRGEELVEKRESLRSIRVCSALDVVKLMKR